MTATATLPPIKHGTETGARVHRQRGDKPCESCRDAESAAKRARHLSVAGRNRAKLASASKPAPPTYAQEDWREHAACKGKGKVMDPGAGQKPLRADVDRAVAVCMSCPVRGECLTWVMGLTDTEDVGGIVAGFTEAERSKKRARAKGRRANRTRRAAS